MCLVFATPVVRVLQRCVHPRACMLVGFRQACVHVGSKAACDRWASSAAVGCTARIEFRCVRCLQVGSIINFAAVYLLAPVPAAPGGAAALSLASKVRLSWLCSLGLAWTQRQRVLLKVMATALPFSWNLTPTLPSIPG